MVEERHRRSVGLEMMASNSHLKMPFVSLSWLLSFTRCLICLDASQIDLIERDKEISLFLIVPPRRFKIFLFLLKIHLLA